MKQIDLDDLCASLMDCFQRSRSVLAKNRCTANQASELAEYVANIRMLLQELDHAVHLFVGDSVRVPSISELWKYYFELEGYVKELRNDLNEACSR